MAESGEYIREGYIRFSAREESIQEFIEKKREQYSQFRSAGKVWDIYQCFYDDLVLRELLDLHPYLMDRNTRIGEHCAEVWTEDHNQLILDNTGNLSIVYSRINDLSDRNKITKAILSVAEDKENPFIWSKVLNRISDIALKDKLIKKELRIYFEKNYYAVYLREYDATNLYNFYLIDKNIDFHFGRFADTIADYQWIETYLRLLDLEKLLDAPDWKIVLIKKSRYWAKVLQKYIDICNRYVVGRDIFESICVDVLDNTDMELEVSKIKTILDMENKTIYSEGVKMNKTNEKLKENIGENFKVDVLIIIATMEEEKAIRKDCEWESKKTEHGYEYFVRREGLNFALARAVNMGMENGALSAQYFVNLLNPQYLAMAGFCAGNHKKVHLGDVIVPDKVYQYETGKQLSEIEVLPEINAFHIDYQWKQRVERFGSAWRESIIPLKPVSYESQFYVFLKQMNNQQYKVNVEDLKKNDKLPDIRSILKEEIDNGHLKLEEKFVVATETGKEIYNNKYLLDYPEEYCEPEPEVKVGALATGNKVQQQKEIFSKLEKSYERKTYAIDMEGYAIADIAQFNKIPYIIAKGVGDFASDGKSFDNRYIEYSVFSAYRFLVAFFKELAAEEKHKKI